MGAHAVRCVTDVVTPSLELSGVSASYLADGTTEHTFTVTSNVAWTASATTNPSAVKSFDATGTANTAGQTFKFKLNTATAAGSVVFTFKSADGTVTKTATVNYTAPGIGGGGNPGGYTKAPMEILAINNLGELNLDGQTKVNVEGTGVLWNYIVLFKWGSTIAIKSASTGDVFDRDDIAWTPYGFDYNTLYTDMAGLTGKAAWEKINYTDDNNLRSFSADDPVNGRGDPCKLAVKDGVATTNWCTPTGYPYASGDMPVSKNEVTSLYWRSYSEYGAGLSTSACFYPATGIWEADGSMTLVNEAVIYWASTSHEHWVNPTGDCLTFDYQLIYPYWGYNRVRGGAIRCIKSN
ncbi:hypothetical protein LJB87_01450 [Alistipes sp. OttesenSCG-928-L06]|nr:hypothetical protein [Alistipes sp. OttesenSCG-928-L06]